MENIGLSETSTRNLIESGDFKEQLQNLIDKMMATRKTQLPDGYKWKRTPEDKLAEAGNLNPDYIISEFQLISSRRSQLSSNVREFIKILIYKAMNNTLISRQRKISENNGKEE